MKKIVILLGSIIFLAGMARATSVWVLGGNINAVIAPINTSTPTVTPTGTLIPTFTPTPTQTPGALIITNLTYDSGPQTVTLSSQFPVTIGPASLAYGNAKEVYVITSQSLGTTQALGVTVQLQGYAGASSNSNYDSNTSAAIPVKTPFILTSLLSSFGGTSAHYGGVVAYLTPGPTATITPIIFELIMKN